MRSIIVLLLFAHGCLSQSYKKEFSPLLEQHTSPSNPGIFLRLMPTGLAYMREIGMKVVNEQILKLELPTIRERIESGEVSINRAFISKYWAPQEYSLDLVEPNRFSWSMSKMHIRAAGDFQASLNNPLLLPTVPITGHFEALLGHVALSISVNMHRNSRGAPQVNTALCQASIGYVDLNVRNTGVITDFFINAFKAFLIANFKPQVEQRMCKMIETIIDQDMNTLLSTMPLKVRINEENLDVIGTAFGIEKPRSKLGAKALRNLTLVNVVQNLREKDLLLDYQLTSDPFIQGGSIAMMSKGEISWRGLGGTPFYPTAMKIPPPQGVHMIEFYASDYLANSMLYHAFRQHLMDMVVGPESSPQLKDLLLTSCDAGFCIGEFLGALSEQYPGREVEIAFTAKKSPLIVFVENRARFRLHGRMNMFVRPANATQVKELIIRSDTTMTANVLMRLSKSKIVGNATIENLDFKLIESKVEDVDEASFADLGLFGAEFLEKLLTEILQLGIAMPQMQGIILKSPKLSFHDRYLKVQTYFKLDEQFAGKIVRGAVKQTLNHVG